MVPFSSKRFIKEAAQRSCLVQVPYSDPGNRFYDVLEFVPCRMHLLRIQAMKGDNWRTEAVWSDFRESRGLSIEVMSISLLEIYAVLHQRVSYKGVPPTSSERFVVECRDEFGILDENASHGRLRNHDRRASMRKSCYVGASDRISDVMRNGRIEVFEKEFERGF